jgi:ABC-type Fe3+ transport system permease subunit
MLVAWLLARTDLAGKRLVEIAITVPLFISPLLGALAWIGLGAPNSGLVNVWIGEKLHHLNGNLDSQATFAP